QGQAELQSSHNATLQGSSPGGPVTHPAGPFSGRFRAEVDVGADVDQFPKDPATIVSRTVEPAPGLAPLGIQSPAFVRSRQVDPRRPPTGKAAVDVRGHFLQIQAIAPANERVNLDAAPEPQLQVAPAGEP